MSFYTTAGGTLNPLSRNTAMRILVEPSDYTFWNVGDTAMLQVAITRLSTHWPGASIQVLTDDPDSLSVYCPDAKPLVRTGRQTWFVDRHLFGGLFPYVPKFLTRHFSELERILRRRWPALAASLMRLSMKLRRIDYQDLSDFLEAVAQADLVVVAGMGGLTDVFADYALELLDTLGLAIRHGKPTAMFGQGIGPIQSPILRARAKEILPRVDLIALREGRVGEPFLGALGVPPDHIMTTGDDAVEMAYQLRTERLGWGLGVNLRRGWYSEVDPRLIERVRPILQEAARIHDASIIPIPISYTPGEEDILTIRQLTSGYRKVLDEREDLDAPVKVIKQIQHCRVVVTGSYHAAVFALAQGIPSVNLAKSAYYVDKFMGLADQFGPGCEVVFLKDAQLSTNLAAAIERAWMSAEQVRLQLLEAAERQIELSSAAYQRVYELIESRRVAAGNFVKTHNLASAD